MTFYILNEGGETVVGPSRHSASAERFSGRLRKDDIPTTRRSQHVAAGNKGGRWRRKGRWLLLSGADTPPPSLADSADGFNGAGEASAAL